MQEYRHHDRRHQPHAYGDPDLTSTATRTAHVAGELHSLCERLTGIASRAARAPQDDAARRELVGACREVETLAERVHKVVGAIRVVVEE